MASVRVNKKQVTDQLTRIIVVGELLKRLIDVLPKGSGHLGDSQVILRDEVV